VIAGMLLIYFGSGPVRGFAVVMMIGIATSVFTAVTVTRMFVSLWLRKRPTELTSRSHAPAEARPRQHQPRFPALADGRDRDLAAADARLDRAARDPRGLNFGVDFAGGQVIRVTFQQPPSLDELREPRVGGARPRRAQHPGIRLPRRCRSACRCPEGGEEGANAAASKVRAG
jgi:preprotein translocase subunit SecF